MFSRKYVILPHDSLVVNGHRLYRIVALKQVNRHVRAGDVGGYVEEDHNLSQSGTCWVYNDAMVYDKARVSGHAQIRNSAQVYDKARVSGYAWIENRAKVYGHARVRDYARVYNSARVYDKARISGNAQVWMNGSVFGKARVSDYSEVYGDAQVTGNVRVRYHTDVSERVHLSGNLRIGKACKFISVITSMSTINKLGNFPRKSWVIRSREYATQALRE
jgi:UDP-3-O-[3-hydroxymyristoyl] glucosamine N-acyltransferase